MDADPDPDFMDSNLDSPAICRNAGRPPGLANGVPDLHGACALGDLAGARFAVVQGVDVGRANLDGWRPLHLAAQSGHDEVARWLLGNGARVDHRSRHARAVSGCTALHVAVSAGHRTVVATLLAAGADPDLRDEAGMGAMHMASLRGDLAMVKQLIRAGAAPEPYLADHTPLDLARRAGHGAVVALLRQVCRRPKSPV